MIDPRRRVRALEVLLEQRAEALAGQRRRRLESQQAVREMTRSLSARERELQGSAARGWLGEGISTRVHRQQTRAALDAVGQALALAVEDARVHEEREREARLGWVVARRLARCPPG